MKRKGILGILPFLLATSGYGLTVEEAYRTVIDTNPEVRQRIEDYRAVEEDKTIAFADYLPVVDIQGSVGYKHDEGSVGSFDPNNDQDDYLHTEAFVRARENLFRGFSTMYDVAQQDARLLSAEHSLMEKVSQLGLSMIESYLGVLKQKQLLALTVENRDTHQRYYDMIKERVEAGAGTQSDMEQISGRLALAESNVKVAMNNYDDAQTSFKRIYGEAVNPDDMMEADINASLLPESIEAAEKTAVLRYPTLMANRKNIEAAQAAYRQAASNYYPTVDLEVKETHVNNDRTGDYAWRTNSGDENEFTVQLIASWNLYNGGSDVAGRNKALASAFNASEKMMENQRLVFERLNYSWAAKTRIAEQLEYLKDHRDFTQKTLQAYLEEFRLGRRTLLDVLDVENEYYTSRKAYVSALYDQQLSEYRVIENVGNLPLVAAVKPDEILALKRDAMAETKVPASE
ncbi:TolC family outer membrane protein [Sulfurimonas sp. HSL1-2]|uniref:TolC family outer membrane protein n=1 Tax=Thiomicrolovo zhangzhouensis TaxID=3131933 RepID=UPI0031F884BE